MKYLLYLLSSLKRQLGLATICSLLVLLSAAAHANNNLSSIKLEQFSTPEGLSQSNVYSIVQDDQGFIWIATADGLNRYDGFEFVHYRHDIENPHSIANNFIRKLYIDSEGVLWIGTSNGLSKYRKESDDFINFSHDSANADSLLDNVIWDIYEGSDKQGNSQFFIATETGLQLHNRNSNKFEKISIPGFEQNLGEIKTIFQDDKGDYWLGTFSNGIILTNQSFTLAKNLMTQKEKTSRWNFDIKAKSLLYAKKIAGNYWFATTNGLYIFNEERTLLKHVNTENGDQKLSSNEIRGVVPSNNKSMVIATTKGLYEIDVLTFQLTKLKLYSAGENANIEPWFMASLKAKNGDIWFGSNGGGLYHLKGQASLINQSFFNPRFHDTNITAVEYGGQDKLIIADESGGLYLTKRQKHEKIPTSSSIVVDKIYYDETSKKVFLYTYQEEIYHSEQDSKKYTKIDGWDSNKTSSFYSPPIILNNKVYFINNESNLECFDLTNNEYTVFNFDNVLKISSLSFKSPNSFWVSSEDNSIYTFELDTGKFTFEFSMKEMQIPDFKIVSILEAPKNIWVTSGRDGLIAISKTDKSHRIFNENKGLRNNFVAKMLLDRDGVVWFGSNKGITAIRDKDLSIKHFDTDYGLFNVEFFTDSSTILDNNDIYMGSNRGLISFSPDALLNSTQNILKPVITDVKIANKHLASSKQVTDLNSHKRIDITYKQFPLSIAFVSPNSSLPAQTAYKYRLIGLEDDWIQTNLTNRQATYTNLSPGTYTFEFKVYDLFDPDLTQVESITLNVIPPIWATSSAKIVYAFVTFVILAYIFQQYRRRLQYHFQIKKSEERLKLSLWGSGDEMWDWNIKTKKIFRSNIWGLLEFPQDGTRNVGTEQTNIHPNDIERVKEAMNAHFENQTEHFETTYRVKDKNEQWIWVLDRGKVVERDDKDKPIRMTGTLKDISHIKKAEERLKLFAKCIENISDAVVIYDRQFTIVDVNKAFVRITGKAKNEMLGKSLAFTRYPESFTQSIKKHLITHGNWQGEIESRRNGNERYFTDLTLDVIRDESGNISHFVGVFSDVTSRKKSEADLRKLANSDTLTGLPNRSFFQANQTNLVKNKTPHALLVFDLDNFKKINDSMGHQVGDLILVEVAKRILKIGSKRNTVYRLGGDEFSVIIENTNDIHTITSLAKEILRIIAQPLKLKNQEIVLYSSIGIVLYPEDGASPQELLKNADTAMYHAKDSGGNRYQFFSESMNKQAVKRIQIESLIRHGLKEDLFSVFYQPKIQIASGKIAGMEALVRFETPTKGVISPAVFIPVSEETGQIIDIGEIVLRKSCYAAKRWVDAGMFDGRVAVNLSAVQFTQPNLPKMIASILEESKLPAKFLELEITEGTVMDNPQAAIDTMLQIRSMGIHLSLDDFGTGYSSLAYLKKFPLNTLKIDKAFVDDIEVSEQGRNMVATIVTIAHNLGMQVVAEGVENNNQLNFLAGLGCEQLQGYLYSKPLAENEFQKYLLSHQITDQSTNLYSKS